MKEKYNLTMNKINGDLDLVNLTIKQIKLIFLISVGLILFFVYHWVVYFK